MNNILVTGGLGFIGSQYARLLAQKGYYPAIIDKMTYAADVNRIKDIEDEIYIGDRLYIGDICNKELIQDIINKHDINVIVNFAAETHVDNSIEDSREFVKSNFEGVQVLLDLCRENDIDKYVQISCYDESTRALTVQGLKNYHELREGDLVFSLNPNTFDIEIKHIKKVIIQHYEGPMVHFRNKRIDLLVTPNHNMFILDTTRKLCIESANNASKRSIFYMPKGIWKGKTEEHYEIGGFWKVDIKDLMYILGIYIGDGFTSYQEKEKTTKKGTKTICHAYRIFFDIPTTKKCRKRVEETLTRMQIFWHPHSGMAGEHIYFSGKEWMEFFDQCGKGAKNKRIPRWVLEYSPDILKHLFEGLIGSDGSLEGEIFADNSWKMYYTSSVGLLSDISELCIKLGYDPSIHNRNIKDKEIHIQDWYNESRKIAPTGDSYYIFIANTTKSISANKKHDIVDYNGDIWCLQVEDNKNFIVERHGRFDFCGNTDEVYGSAEKWSFDENERLSPGNPYSATKAAADLLCLSYWNTYQLPIVITRSSNNYGPYQHTEKFIPKMITSAIHGKPLLIYGDGSNIRDWLYVKDNCKGILQVMEKGKIGEIYNIGGGKELTNNYVASLIAERFGIEIKYIEDRKGHDKRYSINCDKIKNELEWKPVKKFEDGLNDTIRYYVEEEKRK